jgi:uncharacterized protein
MTRQESSHRSADHPSRPPRHTTLVCPTCNQPFVHDPTSKDLPFCSQRCQRIDLGRWLGEAYGLPHHNVSADDDELPPEA